MSVNKDVKRITVPTIIRLKEQSEKITMLTAYDALMAQILDESGIDIVLVGESWAEVEGEPDCGKIHVYKLGASVEVGESVEEGTTVVSETETPEPNGGISGFPLLSIGIALVLLSVYLSRTQYQF